MRRQPTIQYENQLALATAEIERLKADIARFSDGSGLVITTPTTGSGPADGPPTTPGAGVEPLPHVLYGSKHTRSLHVTEDSGLDIAFEQGQEWVAGVFYSIGAGSLTMADNDTNYVFVDTTGAVAANTTGFPSASTPLAEVVTVAGAITSVADRRSYLAGGVHGSGILLGNPLKVGVDDTDQGTLILYGDGAGSTDGGAVRFHLAADHDATFEYWAIVAYQDDLRFFSSDSAVVNVMTAEGQLQLPATGLPAGIVIGGDTRLYRSAPNVLRLGTGDTFAVGDADYRLAMVGGNARITLDANDYWEYNRASDYYEWVIDSVPQMLMGGLGGAGIFDGAAHQVHFPMVADQDILIDGATNLRTIDTGVMRFEQVPAIPDTRALTVNVDANSQPGTHAIVVNMVATAIAAGEVISAYDVNLIAGNSSGGIMRAFEVSMVGNGIEADAMHVDPGVSPLTHHSGSFVNVESAWANAVDVTASFNSDAVDATLFAANGDVVTIGMDAPFDDIEVILATVASGAGVKPTFEYSTGGPGWTPFTVSDESLGFRQGGLISWEIGDLAGWATQVDNGVDKYWIRITRTQVGLTTPPIEDTIQVQAVTEYGWNAIGDATIRNLRLRQGHIQLEGISTPAIPDFDDMHFFTRIVGSRIQLIGQGPTGAECVICDVSNDVVPANTLALNWIE